MNNNTYARKHYSEVCSVKTAVGAVVAIIRGYRINGKRLSIEESKKFAEETFAEYGEILEIEEAAKVGGNAIYELLPEFKDLTCLEDRCKQVGTTIHLFLPGGYYSLQPDDGTSKLVPLSRYEKPERELFEASKPCIFLTGIPDEEYEYFLESQEDEDLEEYLAPLFAKEYPELSMEELEKKFASMDVGSIESMYGTLDVTGSGLMLGYSLPDSDLSKEKMKECFDKIVENFEAQRK